MAHKVNPYIFRAQISRVAPYQLTDPLLANIFLYRMIKSFVFHYSAPYVSYKIKRNTDHKKIDFIPNHKKSLTSGLSPTRVGNTFLKRSLIFSHLNISYAPSLFLSIFFLDNKAERKRVRKDLPPKAFCYLSERFSHKFRLKAHYILKKSLLKLLAKDKKRARKYLYYYRLKRILRRSIRKKFRKLFRKVRFRKLKAGKQKATKKRKRKTTKKKKRTIGKKLLFPLWLSNFHHVHITDTFYSNILRHLRILKFLLRYFKIFKNNVSKKRLFFMNILIASVSSLLALLPINQTSKRLSLFLNLCYMYTYSFKYLHIHYGRELIHSRIFLFNHLAKFTLVALKKVAFFATGDKLILRIYGLHHSKINAEFLAGFMTMKLKQFFIIRDVLRLITYQLNRSYNILSYRIVVSGRLTRRERASFMIRKNRRRELRLSSIKTSIDYAAAFCILKFGVVGVKVYLQKRRANPYLYFFEFKVANEKIS
jgi:hypothetical protein